MYSSLKGASGIGIYMNPCRAAKEFMKNSFPEVYELVIDGKDAKKARQRQHDQESRDNFSFRQLSE